MRIPRIYFQLENTNKKEIVLPPQISHYILKVLRLKTDSKIIIFNGNNELFYCTISEAKKLASIIINKVESQNNESHLQIHLYQGISKNSKMDIVIQKATELGVTEITPIFTDRSEVKLDAKRLENKISHWRGIIISACEQCGRNSLPKINNPIEYSKAISSVEGNNSIILSPLAKQSLKSFLLENKINSTNNTNSINTTNNLNIFIGPEGGFCDDEIESAIKNNIVSLNFGKRILRTETAAISIVTACQLILGDLV